LLPVDRAQHDVGSGEPGDLFGLLLELGEIAGAQAGRGGEGPEGGDEAVEVAVDHRRDLARGGQGLEGIAVAFDRRIAQQQEPGEDQPGPQQQHDQESKQRLG
jgi:hypothetical protein